MGQIEKLRALLVEWRESLGDPCEDPNCAFGPCRLAERIDTALAEPVEDDFKRGAEAMREAAAQVLDAERAEYGGGGNAAALCWQMASKIRALPVPEDK